MKKFTFLKIMFLAVCMTASINSYALTAGDIAIIGMNTDVTKTITFVALADIPANTTISFTDNGWDATNQVLRSGEGVVTWSNTSMTPAGTVVSLTVESPYGATVGEMVKSGSFTLSTSGDQILVYEGTTVPSSNDDVSWLFAFSTENFAFNDNSNSSDCPTALTSASVAMSTTTGETDNAFLTGVTFTGTKSELLEIITNADNYTKSDDPMTVPSYSFTVTSTSSIENATNKAVVISAIDGNIEFIANGGENVQIFNALGQTIMNMTAETGTNTIAINAKGVVIVKIGKTLTKIVF